jgi:O-antigen/teichoic acid export membrane protein
MNTPSTEGQRQSADGVLRNSFLLLVSTFSMAALGFVFWVIVARLYSPAEVGLATSLISSSTLIAFVSLFGLNNTLVRFRAPDAVRDGQLTQCFLLVGVAACLVGSMYLLGLRWYGEKLLFIQQHPLQATAFVLICACNALSLLTDAIFIGERVPEYTVLTDGVVQSLTKLALPVALAGMGAFGIVAANGSGYLAGVLASFVLMYRKLGFRPHLLVRGTQLVEQLGFSLATYAASLLNLAPLLALPLIVLQRLGAAEAGFYFAAFQIATLLNAVSYCIGEALFAEVSNDKPRFTYLLRRSALLMAGMQVPAAVVAALCAGFVLRLFGGQYAAQAHSLLVVLAFGSVAVGLYTWASYALKLARRLKHLMIGNVIYCAVIVGFSVILATRGLVWLGWAWTAGNLASGIYCVLALAGTRSADPPGRRPEAERTSAGAQAGPRTLPAPNRTGKNSRAVQQQTGGTDKDATLPRAAPGTPDCETT